MNTVWSNTDISNIRDSTSFTWFLNELASTFVNLNEV